MWKKNRHTFCGDASPCLSCWFLKCSSSFPLRIPPSSSKCSLFRQPSPISSIHLAKECIISDSTSESGSVPIALMRASHIKCHIWVRYSGPRTRAHSRRRGIDSAAATRTREAVKDDTKRIFSHIKSHFSQKKGYHHGSRTSVEEPSASPPAPCIPQTPPSVLWHNTPSKTKQHVLITSLRTIQFGDMS